MYICTYTMNMIYIYACIYRCIYIMYDIFQMIMYQIYDLSGYI